MCLSRSLLINTAITTTTSPWYVCVGVSNNHRLVNLYMRVLGPDGVLDGCKDYTSSDWMSLLWSWVARTTVTWLLVVGDKRERDLERESSQVFERVSLLFYASLLLLVCFLTCVLLPPKGASSPFYRSRGRRRITILSCSFYLGEGADMHVCQSGPTTYCRCL